MFGSTINKFAVLFILVGAVLLSGPVFGFSSLSADRGTNVTTASDDSAYLSIYENYNGQTITSGDAQPLIRLENNFDETLGGADGIVDVTVIDVSGDINQDNALAVANEPEISSGGAANIEIICADDTISGKNTVDVTLEITEASGPSVAVSDKVVEPVTGVEIQCKKTTQTQSGLTDVWVSDLPNNQQSTNQTVEFTLTNELADGERVTIDFKDAVTKGKVNYDSASVSTDSTGTAQFAGNGNKRITYTSNGATSEGATIQLGVSGINTQGSKTGTYDVAFEKDGEPDTVTTSFTVG